ncbi:MAG: hypothetical protein OXS28_00840 [Gammaproteobacteria bacterium]|nr:hypothetical protein [Gammaproteobacteria bacterium]
MSEDKDKKDEGALTEIGEENQDIIEPGADIQATLEKLGKEKPDTVTEIMAMMGTGPMPNPLHQKMNEGHITQVLELVADHDERQYNLHKNSQANRANGNIAERRYTFATFIILIILVIVILVLFKDNPETLVPIMTGIGGLIGGFLGGWGFARSRHDNNNT